MTLTRRVFIMMAMSDAAALRCPSCGAFVDAGCRSCGYCHVVLASVRCARCFSLHYSGSSVCSSCGATLGLEGELGPTGEACPRCKTASLVRRQVGVYELTECDGCTGVFLDHAVLERATRATEAQMAARMRPSRTSVVPQGAERVQYLPCPRCNTLMARKNFGEGSGVIVDVCKAHGVWFDAEELERAIDFVATGGLERTRARTAEREKLRAKEDAKVHAAFQAAAIEESRAGRFMPEHAIADRIAHLVVDFLFRR